MRTRTRADIAVGARVKLPLDRFDLDVDIELKAPITGVFGASGCGKTSLLECLAGLRPDAKGSIWCGETTWLDSELGVSLGPHRRGVGWVPQEGLLFPHLTVEENLLFGSSRSRVAPFEFQRLTREVVHMLELGPLLGRRAVGLSGGERQRVALGRALLSAPRLLLLDEPLGALDAGLRRRLLPLLERVCQRVSAPVILVSHDPTEVLTLCQEVIVLERGRVKCRGTPHAVLADPLASGSAGHAGVENVLPGVVVEEREDLATVRVGSGVQLVARSPHVPSGAAVVVVLRAADILVARGPLGGLSARNVLRATVTAVHPGAAPLVRCEINREVRLTVELSRRACAELELAEGVEVSLVFKASSCRVHAPASG
jgi:molybdate transport system ATP-binding protein